MAISDLSKSLFIRGRQCHKSLWLHKNRPELKDELSHAQQAIFQSGTDVGILAQKLFPGGVLVPYEGLSHPEQLEQTKAEIEKGTETIYEATFLHDGIFVKADILHRGKHDWEIYEVKGVTKVKDVHCFDAALQYRVLTGAGLEISKVAIVHINNRYTRQGALDIHHLFTISDVTGTVQELQPELSTELTAQREMLARQIPDIDIGKQCGDPYPCDFKGHCWQHIPDDSVFELRERGADKFALYRQGIIRQSDIPLDVLNRKQRMQVESTLAQTDHINHKAIAKFMEKIWYPLCFLDFETFMDGVPPFDDCRPFQKIPFQYSLHLQHSPDTELLHFEFLAEPGTDPRRDLLITLLEQLPENACILAWNQSFEIGVLKELATNFPDRRVQVEKLIENFQDLMQPFKSRDIYLWQAKGSYSIKPVLSLLVPELSYKNLKGVANGGDAMEAWHTMNVMKDPEELATLRKELLDYCERDTLAMVRILEWMQRA